MSWPIYYKDLLKFGNPNSQVGIATLWTITDEIVKDIDSNLFCVAGQLYTKNGINYLVRNLLANKNIRYLVICGQDRAGSGVEIMKLWENGRSEFLHKEIDPASIQKMIQNIQLVNLIGEQNGSVIAKKINELNQTLEPYGQNEEFPEPKNEDVNSLECHFPTDISVFKVQGKTVSETWLKILKNILKFGDVKETDSMKIKEVCNMAAIINDEDPDKFYLPEWLGFGENKVEEYLPQILSKEKIEGLHYTYGFRLGTHFGIDQIEKIIEKLKNDENAREAVGVLFDPRIDIEAEHRPCIVLVQALRNQGKLNLNVYIRSNDMFGGWPLNAFGFRKVQDRICKETGIPMGPLTILSASAHIYDFNWNEANKLVKKFDLQLFEADPRGYFKIDISKETKNIIAQHFNPEGFLLQTFQQDLNCEKPAFELAKKIDHSLGVSFTMHAFDLGIELSKAEMALKMDIDYVQDKPLNINN